jgi:acetylornithine deacetylase/succinyl-diaminopimelate desuccinylase-like protein
LSKQRSRLRAQGAYKKFPDPAPLQVLAVEANRTDPQIPLSVPSQATVRLYMQFLPQENVDAVIRETLQHLEKFSAADPFFRKYPVQWRPLIGGPLYGQEVDPDHPWLQCMEQSAAQVLGKPAITTAAPYPCDAGLIHRDFNIPTLLFGPCGSGAHNPDESVDFNSVLRTAEVLLTAALAWTNA